MPSLPRDINAEIAGLLRTAADAYGSDQRKWAYTRAAATVLGLREPLTAYRDEAALQLLPNIGPRIARIIVEYLRDGRSEAVERITRERSATPGDAGGTHALRMNFLSGAAVQDALEDPKLAGVTLDEYRGDFQWHSTWSDGGDTIDRIVQASIRLGHDRACVTDHSYGLPIARGMSMADVARQHVEIDSLNKKYRGRFRLLKGIEANIRADGTVDLEPDELRVFDLVMASPHSLLRRAEDQTARMRGAVMQPGVHILGHPRGRRYNQRAGVQADWKRVFRAAAARGVAIEIDGYVDRQDIDFSLARQALDAGCVFALDSDAHSAAELAMSRIAVAHARLAGIPADRVINCWPDDRLTEWAEALRCGQGSRKYKAVRRRADHALSECRAPSSST